MKKRVRLEAKDPKDTKESKSSKESKDAKREDKTVDAIAQEDADQNEGFGEWLRSSNGVELMRLFVIANSIVVFVTMAWPNMQEALYIIRDFITGED